MDSKVQVLPYWLRVLSATLVLGVGSGLVGIACHYLLEGIQLLAFGGEDHDLLKLFESASDFRRFLVLCLTGFLAAGFWYLLQSRHQIFSIKKQMELADRVRPDAFVHLSHAIMQVAIVGAGASVGKEGAPREVGALLGGRLSRFLRLSLSDQRLLIACGAGAGLAAVYQVPFASSLFVLETLGIAWTSRNVLLILISCYLADFLAQPLVGNAPLYQMASLSGTAGSFLQALLLAAVVTPLAMGFAWLTKRASKNRIKDRRILWGLPIAFLALAVVAIYFPIFMGNGQVMAQWLLSEQSLPALPLVLILKGLFVYLLLRNGAYGGTLTPSFALGIGAGYLVTVIANRLGFAFSPSMGMLLGASVFLG
ncbi:chloride channel protein, partial [Streptococcus sp. DD10]|uniref:chloride channel protein n=1 Tax=Streptococcus sp. DD10 TaxID=1777878 RepID=UPI00082E5BF2